ncbi:MAG: hypothetical protein H6509_12080 [Bryobacterales bacterium]|nr:hypothetical protein [Bryobacterales bacterium]
MRTRLALLSTFALLAYFALSAQNNVVEVVEIGRDNVDQMPKGKEADGLPGDFVLRNERSSRSSAATNPSAART